MGDLMPVHASTLFLVIDACTGKVIKRTTDYCNTVLYNIPSNDS